jgi:hypothetical protein
VIQSIFESLYRLFLSRLAIGNLASHAAKLFQGFENADALEKKLSDSSLPRFLPGKYTEPTEDTAMDRDK